MIPIDVLKVRIKTLNLILEAPRSHCYTQSTIGSHHDLTGSDGEIRLCEALSFSAKWFTKGLISGGFICSQYHLVAKECKTSRYITDRVG